MSQEGKPNPEVQSRPERRRILVAAEKCLHGQLGSLLRREGLTYTQLSDWCRGNISSAARQNHSPWRITKQGRRELRYAMIQATHNAVDHPKWRKERPLWWASALAYSRLLLLCACAKVGG